MSGQEMLGLTLRDEFKSKKLSGTAIELSNAKRTGATQTPAEEFLEKTYPSGDLIKALEAISGRHRGRPIVVMGERGLGKSHLMATLHHALTSPSAIQNWLAVWADRLDRPHLRSIQPLSGYKVISESLSAQEYDYLWDVVFKHHPRQAELPLRKSRIPAKSTLETLLEQQPMALILDEFQTWFDGRPESEQKPERTWAFNFIQTLTEIAQNFPERLILIVSVRNGESDAFQQIHRLDPLRVDFKGQDARQDRLQLLLHRIFANRQEISDTQVLQWCGDHPGEFLRLNSIPEAQHAEHLQKFQRAWPFSPQLIDLLEDQVLVATDAQETRDLIRILAGLFKNRGKKDSVVLTAADFDLGSEHEEAGETAALLDSVSSERHRKLRRQAIRNYHAVRDAVGEFDNLKGMMSSLWIRSLAAGNSCGAEPHELQLDTTRRRRQDDNRFGDDLQKIKDNAFNIHTVGSRLVFQLEDNPQTRLLSEARNDKLFNDGSDRIKLGALIRSLLANEINRTVHVIPLMDGWESNPWENVLESQRPENWGERVPLIVLPEFPEPSAPSRKLGPWLKKHVTEKRNTVRFLLPDQKLGSLVRDSELLVTTRAFMKAEEWSSAEKSSPYKGLAKKFKDLVTERIKERFTHFAILKVWDHQEPERSQFVLERVSETGPGIPDFIEKSILNNLFIPENFQELVLESAAARRTIQQLLDDLSNPRPNKAECIPWIGETQIKEKLIRLCAKGHLAINVRGSETLNRRPDESEEAALARFKGKLGSGRHLEQTTLELPTSQSSSQSIQPPPAAAAVPEAVHDRRQTDDNEQPANAFTSFATTLPSQPQSLRYASSATAPINLRGRLEEWRVQPASRVRKVQLTIDRATGQQLQELLNQLPDGLRFALELELEVSP